MSAHGGQGARRRGHRVARGRSDRGPKDGKVGLTAPVLLDAGPACDERTAGCRISEKRLDERRLPDARIAGHKNHLAPTLEGGLEVGPQES